MWRVTRAQWIDGKESRRIGYALAKCAVHRHSNAWSVFEAAVPSECRNVGMIRGLPPAFGWEPHYMDVLAAVRANQKRGAVFVEMALIATARADIGELYENNW